MSRQGAKSYEKHFPNYYVTKTGGATVHKPNRLYFRIAAFLSDGDFDNILNLLVSRGVISEKQKILLVGRANNVTQAELGKQLGHKTKNVGTLESQAWGKIMKWLTDQGKTLEDLGTLIGQNAESKQVDTISKVSEMIQELGGVDAIKKRIEEEKMLGGFIKLLAEIMEFVVNHPDMGRDEMNDSLYNGRKAESRARADVLVCNAIDYFLVFPSPDSTPGVESGSEVEK